MKRYRVLVDGIIRIKTDKTDVARLAYQEYVSQSKCGVGLAAYKAVSVIGPRGETIFAHEIK